MFICFDMFTLKTHRATSTEQSLYVWGSVCVSLVYSINKVAMTF